MDWHISIAGLFVGFLIGLTGMGGGALMTPILIFLGVRPTVAIGTDLVYAAITKIFGGTLHLKQRSVDLTLVFFLALGSVPGSLIAVNIIKRMSAVSEAGVDEFLTHALGLTLLLVAATLLIRPFVQSRTPRQTLCMARKRRHHLYTVLLGFVVGFLVGLTSVGSGTLILIALLMLYPYLVTSKIVGTDVFHGAILVSAAGLAHFTVGNVNLPIVGSLLVGSIPGVLLGSRLSVQVPEMVLRPILATVLLVSGWRLI